MKKIKLSEPLIGNEEFLNLKKVLRSGWLTTGKKTQELEYKIKKTFKVNNVIAVNSCTSGIYVSLVANKINEGDEVITSPFTFVSTINSLYHLKTKIVLVDINLNDYNIDTNEIHKKLNDRTKCILPIHYGGNPADIDSIIKIKKKRKIKIIEDAACAFGAKIGNKFIGSMDTDTSVFSLYGNKVITSGEGGIITIKNDVTAKKIRELIFCGMSKSVFNREKDRRSWYYKVNQPGFKFNLSDIQSAIALAQFKKLEKIVFERKKISETYNKQFQDLIADDYIKPIMIKKSNRSSHYIYTILVRSEKLKCTRDEISNYLSSAEIGNTVHYIPAHKHFFYKKLFRKFKLKNCNYVYDRIISLPMHNKLSQSDILNVSKYLKKFLYKNIKKKLY